MLSDALALIWVSLQDFNSVPVYTRECEVVNGTGHSVEVRHCCLHTCMPLYIENVLLGFVWGHQPVPEPILICSEAMCLE